MTILYVLNLSIFFIILLLLTIGSSPLPKVLCVTSDVKKLTHKTKKQIKQKHILSKQRKVLKPKKLTNKFYTTNFYVFVDGNKLKNFKLANAKNHICFFKNNTQFLVVFHVFSNKTIINIKSKTNNAQNFVVTNINFSNLTKANVNGVKKQCYNHFNLLGNKNIQVFKFYLCGGFKTLNFFTQTTFLKHISKQKVSKKIINKKQFGFSFNSGKVTIKNVENIKNVLNVNIQNLKTFKNRAVVNNTFLIEKQNDGFLVSKKNTSNLFENMYNIFKFKIKTKNEKLNTLINDILPNLLINEYKNNFNFEPFNNFLFVKKNYPYYYKTTIKFLFNAKKYFELYNFILMQVVGVGFNLNTILFFKPQFYIGKIEVCYNDIKLLINNNYDDCYVVYNGIILKNIKTLNLKLNNTIKIENEA